MQHAPSHRAPARSEQPVPSASANPLTGKPLESHLEIYNWSEYDDPSTFTKFTKLPAEAKAGMTLHETFYSSNDELLAKLHAGGTRYDIIVPSQNAVAELIQENSLLALDKALLPNLKNLDPSFLKPSYDPTGDYHVIKDFGITMFFYNNKIVTEEQPKTMHDFYQALPKYVSKGRTNLLDGAEEVVPLALMALGLDPNTTSQADFNQVKSFLLSIRKGVTTIDSPPTSTTPSPARSSSARAGTATSAGSCRGARSRATSPRSSRRAASEIWADNWCIPASAPHPVAAHAWINWLLTPSTAVTEMNYHNYKIPMPSALAQLPPSLQERPAVQRARRPTPTTTTTSST